MLHTLSPRGYRLFFLLAAVLATIALAAAACGGGDDDDGGDNGGDNGGNGQTSFDISMGDNFYQIVGEDERNPTIKIPAGATVTIALTNDGTAIHNLRFGGDDNQYNNDDDAVSEPELTTAGGTATLEFTAPDEPGTYNYQCDFHPTDMLGKFEVE